MRHVVLGVCLAALACGCAGSRPFEDRVPEDDWTRSRVVVPFAKIGRGITNVITSPADISGTVARHWGSAESLGGYVSAPTIGLVEGVFNGSVRIGAGLLEVVSFPLVYQSDPLYNHEYGAPVFGEWGRDPADEYYDEDFDDEYDGR